MSVVSQSARFAESKEDVRGDYSDARPGAFSSSVRSNSSRHSMGSSARTSVFDGPAADTPSVGVYDGAYTSTGAFASAHKSTGVSAAFASKSGRFDRPTSAQPLNSSTAYDTTHNTIGAKASSRRSTIGGGFGSSRRESTWLQKESAYTPDGPHSESYEAPVPSAFGKSASFRSKGPSAAFGGSRDRFATTKAATPGPGEYTAPERKPLSARSPNALARSTMGGSARFASSKVDSRGDYSGAKPGAFSSASKSTSKLSNVGFGGTGSRVTAFDQMAATAAKNAPATEYYDSGYDATSAFASAKSAHNVPSAGFASKSERMAPVAKVADGPAPGEYSSAHGSMASTANRTFNKSARLGTGGFGSAVRRTTGVPNPRGENEAPGPGAYDSSSASFGDAWHAAKPSAAFASKSAKMSELRKSDAPAVGGYDPAATTGMAATATKTFNKRSGQTAMGTSSRFAPTKEANQGDYSDAKEGAFAVSKSSSRSHNTGFGGTASRKSAFEEMASRAAKQAPDTYYAAPSAFERATESSGPSSGFASKSERMAPVAKVADGPAPGEYSSAHGSMASTANRTFNKSVQNGTGGFGSSGVRDAHAASGMPTHAEDDAPGPGAYDSSTSSFAVDAKPSAAFASKSGKMSELRKSDAPGVGEYDAHSSSGMGAVKSFNVKAGRGGFGSRAPRQTHEKKDEVPGAGDYESHDPAKPSVAVDAEANKGKVSGAFASTTLRDTLASWVTGS